MGKTSFQSLDQLVKNISDNINLLNNGRLNSSEIETLTENTRDLYERLIVIRHKAYEKFGDVSATLNIQDQIKETPVVENLSETISESVEESIFDPITAQTVQEDKKEEVEEMMSFDFSESITEIQPEIKEEQIVEPIKEEEVISEVKSVEKETSSLNESISTTPSSLNDGFKSSNSLGDRLNQSKIADLKSSIDINKKFSFITGLFAGSNEDYNEAVNTLNNCTDGDQARNLLGDMAQKHNWDVEEKTVLAFVELVERKFI